MSWQQPNPAWRDVAQRPVALRWSAGACTSVTVLLGALGLTLAAAAGFAAEPPYALLGQAAPDFALQKTLLQMTQLRGEKALGSCAFYLIPDGTRTRLLARDSGGAVGNAIFDIPHFVMEQKMLRGIRDRAQRRH